MHFYYNLLDKHLIINKQQIIPIDLMVEEILSKCSLDVSKKVLGEAKDLHFMSGKMPRTQ